MKKLSFVAVVVVSAGLSISGNSQTLSDSFKQGVTLVADAQNSRTRSEFTKNKIPVRVGACSSVSFYKDTLERRRARATLEVFYCKEKVTFQETGIVSKGRFFNSTNWTKVAGSEKMTYEIAAETQDIDLNFAPDSFRTADTIIRDVKESCENIQRDLTKRMLSEKSSVRCK